MSKRVQAILAEHGEAIIRAYNDRSGSYAIGKLFGISNTVVLRYLRLNNVSMRSKGATTGSTKRLVDNKDYVIQEYESGRSMNSIAKEYQITSHRSISILLKEWGIKTRTIKEQRAIDAKQRGEELAGIQQNRELIDTNREAVAQAKESPKPVTTRGRTLDMLDEKKGSAGLLALARQDLIEFNNELLVVLEEVRLLKKEGKVIQDGMDSETGFSLRRLISGKREDAGKLVKVRAEIAIAEAPLPALEKRKIVLEERVTKYQAKAEKDRMSSVNGMVDDIKDLFKEFQQAVAYKIGHIESKLKEKI